VSNAGSSFVLAFDVGGSHVGAGLVRLAPLELEHRASAPLPPDISFEAFADLISALGREAAGAVSGVAGASLAVPFPFDPEAGVSLMRHKLIALYGQNLRHALALRFAWDPAQFCFLNDACAFLLGEVAAGSAKGAERAVGLTLGTGIGSAFAIHGIAVTEEEGVPPGGGIWNLPYRGGIVEDLISTCAIRHGFEARTGRSLEVVEIAALAPEDPDARAVFDQFAIDLGSVLRDVIAPFHPGIVVIGGGISRSAGLFLPLAEQQIAGCGFHVVCSTLFDNAALVGAAHYWSEQAALSSPHSTRASLGN
jgi:glucokinase